MNGTNWTRPTTGYAVSHGITGEYNGRAAYRPEYEKATDANCRELHLRIKRENPKAENISVGRWDTANTRGCWFAGATLVNNYWTGRPLFAADLAANAKAKADAKAKAAKAKADAKAKPEAAKPEAAKK